jgi:hypothetical protein
MIAHNPLHGSGQASFPHPALALGEDAHAAQGTGMTDGRPRLPISDKPSFFHAKQCNGVCDDRTIDSGSCPDRRVFSENPISSFSL